MTIGERIKNKRIELGLTQDELARRLGYKNRASVNQYENERTMSLDTVEKFAKALGVSPSYLMGWEEKFPLTDNAYKFINSVRNNVLYIELMNRLAEMTDAELKKVYDYTSYLAFEKDSENQNN